MGILKIFFFIFLGLFSLGEIFRFDFGNNFSIKPLDIIAIIIFFTWLCSIFRSGGKTTFRDTLVLPLALFTASMLISLILNIENFPPNEITVAFFYIARWILYASLYFVVKEFPFKFKQKIIYALLAVGGLLILFGISQYFLYPNLRNLSYLGWDEHMVRLFSTFLDPNFASAIFVLYLVFSLSIFLYFVKSKKIKQAWLLGLISAAAILSIFLTYSRSGLVMFLVTAVIFFLLIKKIKLIIGFLLILMIFVFITSRNFSTENMNLFRVNSTRARLDSANVSLEIIKNHIFFGTGFNTYRYAQAKYGFRSSANLITSHADAGTDNSFLFIFATTGIVGLIFYINLLYNLLKKSYLSLNLNREKNIQKYIGIAAFASIGGVIVDSLFINTLFYTFVMIWIWILLGMITPPDSKAKENR